MNNAEKIASDINTISIFLAKRDIPELNSEQLNKKYDIQQADLLILFGASILHGCDLVAKAYQQGMAKEMMIVGGEGHTTDTLRKIIHNKYSEFDTTGKAEADIISYYLQKEYGISDCIIERQSTNCGNNVSNALKVIEEKNLTPEHIIIVQDSSMQMRMDAEFRQIWKHRKVNIINYAPYRINIKAEGSKLVFEDNNIEGLWDVDHFITLQMGEIPRLTDNENGYGPKGKNFIAHVDIPDSVQQAYQNLVTHLEQNVRIANDKWKSN